MKLRILAVGKIRDPWLKAGIEEYSKRLRPYASLSVEELADSPDSWPLEKALKVEAEAVMAKLQPSEYVVLVDLHAKSRTTEALAQILPQWWQNSWASLTFVIAGSNGFDPRLRERAQQAIKLGDVTFTHTMTRLLLLEQLYRCFKIARGEPYHK